MKKIFKLMIVFGIILVLSVIALIDFTPKTDIDMQSRYSIHSVVEVNSSDFYDDGENLFTKITDVNNTFSTENTSIYSNLSSINTDVLNNFNWLSALELNFTNENSSIHSNLSSINDDVTKVNTDLEIVNSSFIDQNTSDHISFETDNLSGNLTYVDIYGWPAASPQYSALTALDDSTTATEGWNLLRPSYLFTHSEEETSLAVANQWYNLTFDSHPVQEKNGINHTYNDGTNDTFTIANTGVYDISWFLSFQDSAANPVGHIGTRIINNNVEINGSVTEKDTTRQNAIGTIDNDIIVSLTEGDELIVQAVSNETTITIKSQQTFGNHPTSVNVNIKRIA